MPTIALVLFALAALGGLFLAVRHAQDQALPLPVSLLHGLFAATGLVLLAVVYFRGGASDLLALALLILVVTALGGFFLVSSRFRAEPRPNAVVVIHALAAVAGVATLAIAIF